MTTPEPAARMNPSAPALQCRGRIEVLSAPAREYWLLAIIFSLYASIRYFAGDMLYEMMTGLRASPGDPYGQNSSLPAMVFMMLIVAVLGIWELLALSTRRAARVHIARLERDLENRPGDAETLARIGRARGAMVRGDAVLDTAAWRKHFGDREAPRVLLFENVRPACMSEGPAGEEIDLGADSSMGPQEIRFWVCINLIALGVCIFITAMALRTGGMTALAVAVWFLLLLSLAVPVATLLAERGLSLFQLFATPCAPGRIEFIRFGRTRVMTHDDTTLVIEPHQHPTGPLGFATLSLWRTAGAAIPALPRLARWWARCGWLSRWRRLERTVGLRRFRRPIRATFIRDDGVRAKLTFMSGRQDPALAELSARWVFALRHENGSAPLNTGAAHRSPRPAPGSP